MKKYCKKLPIAIAAVVDVENALQEFRVANVNQSKTEADDNVQIISVTQNVLTNSGELSCGRNTTINQKDMNNEDSKIIASRLQNFNETIANVESTPVTTKTLDHISIDDIDDYEEFITLENNDYRNVVESGLKIIRQLASNDGQDGDLEITEDGTDLNESQFRSGEFSCGRNTTINQKDRNKEDSKIIASRLRNFNKTIANVEPTPGTTKTLDHISLDDIDEYEEFIKLENDDYQNVVEVGLKIIRQQASNDGQDGDLEIIGGGIALNESQFSAMTQFKEQEISNDQQQTREDDGVEAVAFVCVVCNRDFSTKQNLTRHIVTHEGVRPYGCNVCGKTFSQNGTLKQHMMTHTGEKPYVCTVCNRGFTQCKSLVFHMRRHTGEKPFPCEHCGMFFRQRDGLKTHILKHHMIRQTDGETETHTCIICKQLLATKTALQVHMKKHINSCKTMLLQSSSDITEENSLLELMTDDDMLYDNSFINEELALNIEEVSASAQILNTVKATTAKASRVKKFHCRKCYKCFAIKKNLLRHLTTHDVSVSELFQCTTCQVAFDTNYALRVHRVREHKETNINLNECEYCNITFSNANELSDHNNEVHDSLD